jgi:hypothetical protein
MTEIRNDLGLERLGPGETPREVQPAHDAARADHDGVEPWLAKS